MFRATVVLLSLLIATPALAQSPASPPIDPRTFRASIAAVRFDPPASARGSSLEAAPVPRREMGLGRRIALTSLAGLGGFFAGAYTGAAIEGDRCHCDDPGLKGALIGMPIGTAAAAITTWILTRR